MSDTLEYAVSVRMLLRSLESDAGLHRLTEKERDMLYAFVRLSRCESGTVRSDALRRHPLVAPMTHPTYHRTLRALIDGGIIAPAPGVRTGSYRLTPESMRRLEEDPDIAGL